MEPVSLAIGVVPLVTNIITTTKLIRDKVAIYNATTTNIRAIIDRTTLVGQICERLRIDLDYPKSRYDVEILGQALNMCHCSVDAIYQDLDKVLRSTSGRKRGMRYLFSKADIDRSMETLNEAINMLNLCISLRVLTLSSPVEESLSEPVHPKLDPISQDLTVASSRRAVSGKRAMKKHNYTTTYQNSLFFYNVNCFSAQDTENQDETSHRSYTLGLPLLSWYVSLVMQFGALSPLQLILDTPRVIYEAEDKALYDRLLFRTYDHQQYDGNLAQWAREQKVKAGTQLVSCAGFRTSILTNIIACNMTQACNYLSGLGDDEINHQGHLVFTPQRNLRLKNKKYSDDPTRLYVEKQGPLLMMAEYRMLCRFAWHAGFFCDLYEDCKSIFLDEWEEFLSTTWFGFVGNRITRLGVEGESEGDDLFIARLISDGLDIHREQEGYPWRRPNTALAKILRSSGGLPFDVLESASKWLGSLELAEVDVDKYLQRELDIAFQQADAKRQAPSEWRWMSREAKLETLFDMLSTKQRLAAECGTTDDLLQIMPTLRWVEQSTTADSKVKYSHLQWKKDMMSTYERHILSRVRAILRDNRFHRNQAKKWSKLKKIQGIEDVTKQMPGTWELDWTEYQGGW